MTSILRRLGDDPVERLQDCPPAVCDDAELIALCEGPELVCSAEDDSATRRQSDNERVDRPGDYPAIIYRYNTDNPTKRREQDNEHVLRDAPVR